MLAIAANSVAWSVYVLVITMSHTKTAKSIEMPFGGWTLRSDAGCRYHFYSNLITDRPMLRLKNTVALWCRLIILCVL